MLFVILRARRSHINSNINRRNNIQINHKSKIVVKAIFNKIG